MNESFLPKFEEGVSDYEGLILQAKQEALGLQALERIKDEQDALSQSLLAGKITLEKYNKRVKKFETYPGIIQVRSLTDFTQLLLVLGLADDAIDEIVEHENEHMLKVLSEGCEGFYRIEFSKDNSGNFAFYPAIYMKLSNDLSDEEARAKLQNILNAPTELSERDQSQLSSSDQHP